MNELIQSAWALYDPAAFGIGAGVTLAWFLAGSMLGMIISVFRK